MASNLIDRLSKRSNTLETIMLSIIAHLRLCREALMAYPGFHHHHYQSAEIQ